MRKFALLCSSACVLAACEPRLADADYGYSYIGATETFVSTQRFVGELYLLKNTEGGYVLEELDKEITVSSSDLRNNSPINFESSKVSGASVEVINTGKGTISGSAVFEAKVTSQSAQVSRMSGAVASDKIEELYRQNWTESLTTKTIRADEVLSGDAYYVLVSGAGLADKLELSHGAPDETTNGFSFTINGKEISGVKISNRSFFKCEKSGESRPSCTAAITVYGANLIDDGGVKKLNVFPTNKVKPSEISRAFRQKFNG